eukprot:2374664-Amphidinium_carterae.1
MAWLPNKAGYCRCEGLPHRDEHNEYSKAHDLAAIGVLLFDRSGSFDNGTVLEFDALLKKTEVLNVPELFHMLQTNKSPSRFKRFLDHALSTHSPLHSSHSFELRACAGSSGGRSCAPSLHYEIDIQTRSVPCMWMTYHQHLVNLGVHQSSDQKHASRRFENG